MANPDEKQMELLRTPIEAWGIDKILQRRTIEALTIALNRQAVFPPVVVGDLVRLTETEILKYSGMGKAALRKLKDVLHEKDLFLGGDYPAIELDFFFKREYQILNGPTAFDLTQDFLKWLEYTRGRYSRVWEVRTTTSDRSDGSIYLEFDMRFYAASLRHMRVNGQFRHVTYVGPHMHQRELTIDYSTETRLGRITVE